MIKMVKASYEMADGEFVMGSLEIWRDHEQELELVAGDEDEFVSILSEVIGYDGIELLPSE